MTRTQLYLQCSEMSKTVTTILVMSTAVLALVSAAYVLIWPTSKEAWFVLLRAFALELLLIAVFRAVCLKRAPVDAPPDGYMPLSWSVAFND